MTKQNKQLLTIAAVIAGGIFVYNKFLKPEAETVVVEEENSNFVRMGRGRLIRRGGNRVSGGQWCNCTKNGRPHGRCYDKVGNCQCCGTGKGVPYMAR